MDIVEQLSTYGVLGLLLAIAILAIGYLYKENQALQKEKFELVKEQTTLYLNMANKTVDTLDNFQELLKTVISKTQT